ncbi:MAG: hypothetical protein HFE75_09750 [Firmicutes bacterium]|nr:hypothetical protein [Bacillota bacterium]
MKRVLAFVFLAVLCFCGAEVAYAADGPKVTDLPASSEKVFITLQKNTNYRWNTDGHKGSSIHMNDSSGSNCVFRFDKVSGCDGYYGIKFIKDNGTDRFVDVKDHSKNEGAEIHVWENEDKELQGNKNHHRHWAFYDAGTDQYGNKSYYIQNQESGLWAGLKDSNNPGGSDVVQVSEAKREKWIVTPCVVPVTQKLADDLIGKNETNGVFNFFKKDTLEGINRVSDSKLNHTRLDLYRLGTSSRWRVLWNEKYQGYEIEALNDDNGTTNKVWDVVGEDGSPGAELNLWSKESKDQNYNTSQIWRFVKTSDRTYKIQNARSGVFLGDTYSKKERETILIQAKSGNVDEFTVSQVGVRGSQRYECANPWMKDLPDGASLAALNIPATHDTGTAAIVQDAVPSLSLTSCQSLYFEEQLNVGARSFDIRCNATKDNAAPGDVKIIHGSSLWQCYDANGQELTLQKIFDESVLFLQTNRSETLIFKMAPNAGSIQGLGTAIGEFIKKNKQYVYTGWQDSGAPSLGEARGKIVFVRGFDIDTSKYDPKKTDGVEISWFGPYLKNWGSINFQAQKYAMEVYNQDGVSFYVQDAYNSYSRGKWDYITGTMKQTTGSDPQHTIPNGAFIYNFTSCAVGFPLGLTRDINPLLYSDKASDGAGYIDNRRLGMVMLNFIDEQTSRLIYETNFAMDSFTAKVKFPTDIGITYGQTLDEARLSGQSEAVEGTFRFEDGDYVPTYEDYEKKKRFKLTFTPKDKRLKPVTQEVTITYFVPKAIEIIADDKTIEYGESFPALTWSLAPDALVGSDTKDLFQVSLEVINYAGVAANYDISGKVSTSSKNYNPRLKHGTLRVTRKIVGVQWSDTRNLIYNGSPVSVTAALTGVLKGDACAPVVEGGSEVGPSWNGAPPTKPTKYTATITKLTGKDAGNYKLPDDGCEQDYYIRRAGAEDFAFPTKVTLTYGQKLSEAELAGASGDGEFHFVDDTGNIDNKILAAGSYQLQMVYRPKDSSTEHPAAEKVPVTVQKKPIVVNAKDARKTYGEATSLDFTVPENQLVGSDQKSDLKLTLTAGAGSGDEPKSNVGVYQIEKKVCGSDNYDVTVVPALLTISKKIVEIQWPGSSTYTYTGSPVNIQATVKNKLAGDTCEVKLLGAKSVNAGSYTAVAWGLTNKNYGLPIGEQALRWDYEISKAMPNVTFPTLGTITYGQALAQAKLEGENRNGIQGMFRFAQEEQMPTVAQSGTNYKMRFLPADQNNYQIAEQDVKVVVEAKKLVVNIDDKEKIYNQDTPALTWHMKESQLVGTDSVEEFQFKLTAGDGDNKKCDAGSYAITATTEKQNPNYQIQFDNGRLVVKPLTVEIKWNPVNNIKVGDPAPSANITNLVSGDDCQLTVESDGTAQASWVTGNETLEDLKIFHAKIIGLKGTKSRNYALPEDEEADGASSLSIRYLVRRAGADDYAMPQAAVLTYGQKLSDAWLVLASGDGTFSFVEREDGPEAGNQYLEAGKHDSWVKFTPTDLNKRPVFKKITVQVRPKPITAAAQDEEKVYGERTKLDWAMDESQLALADKKEDLQITLTAISAEDSSGETGDKPRSPAGAYTIELGHCGNANYRVTMVPASLWIEQRVTGVAWDDVSNLRYTGKPANVTARATDLLAGDKGNIKVFNGDQIEIGTYKALAVSISNENYRLDNSEAAVKARICSYTIGKAEPAVKFPERAVMTYGQPLGAAELQGGDKDETFVFAQPAAMLQVADSGKTYTITYTPKDLNHYLVTSKEIPVEVRPVTVSLAWSGTKTRTYDGKASNVRAVAVGLLGDDQASVTVKNGKQKKPGTHTAEATSISNGNYALPQVRTAKYTILAEAAAGGSKDGKGGKHAGAESVSGNQTQTGDTTSQTYLICLAILMLLSAGVMGALWRTRKLRK